METNDLFRLLSVIAIVLLMIGTLILIVRSVNAGQTPPQSSHAVLSRHVARAGAVAKLPKQSAENTGSEGVLTLLLLGVLGVAAYKFVRSGGLSRLLNRMAAIPVTVNGRTTTLLSAINSDADIRSLFLDTVATRLREDETEASANSTHGGEPESFDADIAEMLRGAVERRMRERGI